MTLLVLPKLGSAGSSLGAGFLDFGQYRRHLRMENDRVWRLQRVAWFCFENALVLEVKLKGLDACFDDGGFCHHGACTAWMESYFVRVPTNLRLYQSHWNALV